MGRPSIPEDYKSAVWDRIQGLMAENRVNAITLARTLDISPSVITGWKTGKCLPNQSAVAQMAEMFNVSPNYILGKPTEETVNANALSNMTLAEIQRISDLLDLQGRIAVLAFAYKEAENMKQRGRNGREEDAP